MTDFIKQMNEFHSLYVLLHGNWLFFCIYCPFLFNLHSSSSPPSLSIPHSVFSYLSRPGPAAPSRSCFLQPGSSSPTPQSSMPLSSPTPWAARSLLPTGGEHCFLSFNCTQPVFYWRMNIIADSGRHLLMINKSNRLTCVTLKLEK